LQTGYGCVDPPRYSFQVPLGWEETAVSIADLGGTEIDLRWGAWTHAEGMQERRMVQSMNE
jgi:hypothetical protein